MHKKHILFVIPTCSNNGTNSSLSSVFNALKNEYEIKILPITRNGQGSYEFLKNAIYSDILDAYVGNYQNLSGKVKLYATIIKFIKRLSILLHYNIDSYIYKYAISRIEKLYDFDYIVGFQEGLSMHIASLFTNPNKITWIHCDYNRAVNKYINEEHIYNRFSKIICVSNYTKTTFLTRYPNLYKKTTCIYNLFDENRIKRLSYEKIEDKLFDTSGFTIISVGRMDPVKRFTEIPRLAKYLKSENIQFKWYIIGGPKNNEYLKIKDAIIEYGVEKYVIMLGAKPNPYPFFRNADLYVSTSQSEACPMVFNEARLLDIPIVSANFGSASEFIKNGEDGYICSLDAMHKTIRELITSSNKYQEIQNNARNSMLDNKNTIKQLHSLFV